MNATVFCAYCPKPATCIGQYLFMPDPQPACDDCCQHGCEDGDCYPLDSAEGRAWLKERENKSS